MIRGIKMQENINYLLPLVIVSISSLIVGLIALYVGYRELKRKTQH